jgi:hypothetical protein
VDVLVKLSATGGAVQSTCLCFYALCEFCIRCGLLCGTVQQPLSVEKFVVY